jgi:hypothetical protein
MKLHLVAHASTPSIALLSVRTNSNILTASNIFWFDCGNTSSFNFVTQQAVQTYSPVSLVGSFYDSPCDFLPYAENYRRTSFNNALDHHRKECSPKFSAAWICNAFFATLWILD